MNLNEYLIQNYADELAEAFLAYNEGSTALQEKIDGFESLQEETQATNCYTYRIDHEVIVRGVSTVHSETELSTKQIQAMFVDTCPAPGTFQADTDAPDYPLHYGSVLAINGECLD